MNRLLLVCLPFCALLGACDETDAAAVRLRLARDLSGRISASALQPTAEGVRPPIEAAGVTWTTRVELLCAAGTFQKLSDVVLSDLTLSAGEGDKGICFLMLSLPRGPEVRWARELVPLGPAERKTASEAFDPSGKADAVGETVKFEVTLPSDVVGNGLTGRTRGTKAKSEGEVATLTVPVETALSAGEPIVWHLTWQK